MRALTGPQQDRPSHDGQENKKPLSIITVTYNSADVLQGLLDSIPDGTSGLVGVEVVVVDNLSADNSADLAARHPTCPKVIKMNRNAGYAAGINAAVAAIDDGRHILILNPDIRLGPGAVSKLLERLENPHVGVAVPRMLNEDGSLALSLRREPSVAAAWFEAFLGRWASQADVGEIVGNPDLYKHPRPVDWATGAALAISAQARRLVGQWDESFFLYSEEVDYLRRIRERGFSVTYAPEAQVMHIGGEYRKSPMLSALLTRNRIEYFKRHHGKAATLLFQLGIVTGAAFRSFLSPSHRSALRAALRPSRFPIPQ